MADQRRPAQRQRACDRDGLALQFVLAIALLRFAPVRDTLLLANHVVYAIEAATRAGTTFVFGFLGGGDPPFD